MGGGGKKISLTKVNIPRAKNGHYPVSFEGRGPVLVSLFLSSLRRHFDGFLLGTEEQRTDREYQENDTTDEGY